jgi:hypothetical protein
VHSAAVDPDGRLTHLMPRVVNRVCGLLAEVRRRDRHGQLLPPSPVVDA